VKGGCHRGRKVSDNIVVKEIETILFQDGGISGV
jgi:hypothetical protein